MAQLKINNSDIRMFLFDVGRHSWYDFVTLIREFDVILQLFNMTAIKGSAARENLRERLSSCLEQFLIVPWDSE
jgi:hypothetical protein